RFATTMSGTPAPAATNLRGVFPFVPYAFGPLRFVPSPAYSQPSTRTERFSAAWDEATDDGRQVDGRDEEAHDAQGPNQPADREWARAGEGPSEHIVRDAGNVSDGRVREPSRAGRRQTVAAGCSRDGNGRRPGDEAEHGPTRRRPQDEGHVGSDV